MRLHLDMIPWNEVDIAISEIHITVYNTTKRSGGAVDGFLKFNVESGDGGEAIEVETRERYGYVKYNVFVAKIRRESVYMEEKTQDARTKWTEMAQAFIDHYGETKTPSGIVEKLLEVRERWSIVPDASPIVYQNPDELDGNTKWLMFGSFTVGDSGPGTVPDFDFFKAKPCRCLDHQADESMLECGKWLLGFLVALAVVGCHPIKIIHHWEGKHIVLIGPLPPLAVVAATETIEYLGLQRKAQFLLMPEDFTEDAPDEPISTHSQHQDDADNGTI